MRTDRYCPKCGKRLWENKAGDGGNDGTVSCKNGHQWTREFDYYSTDGIQTNYERFVSL